MDSGGCGSPGVIKTKSSERTIAPFSSDVPGPLNYLDDNCCTDHLEEQIGYGTAGSHAFAGGADVKEIYEPPPLE